MKRHNTHSLPTIQTIQTTYSISETAFDVAEMALKAMLYEIACHPSPGLVSPVSRGAHPDMDYFLFLDSTVSLNRHFHHICEAGIRSADPNALFCEIRELGKVAELAMFTSTGGINTHKGMLFILGILAAAVSRTAYAGNGFTDVRPTVQIMCRGLVQNELNGLKNRVQRDSCSHGERLYLLHEAEGVRGEMERGLPTVYEFGLELYDSSADLSWNDRLVHALLGIMGHCDDTTILHRKDMETLEAVKAQAIEALNLGGMRTTEGRVAVEAMNERFNREGISPGGSADLLGATVFLSMARQYLNLKTQKE